MAKKKFKQENGGTEEGVVMITSARDIEPTLAMCRGCRQIVQCYSYPIDTGGFVYYCLECKPAGDDTIPKDF